MNAKAKKLIERLNEAEKNDKTKFKTDYEATLQKLSTDDVELLFRYAREDEQAWHHANEWKGAVEEF